MNLLSFSGNLGRKYLILSFLFQSGVILIGKQASIVLESFGIKNILFNYYYWGVILLLAFQALTWQLVLKYYPLSQAYFYMSGVYGIILISSYFIYDESISYWNIAGMLIIVIGIINLTRKEKS